MHFCYFLFIRVYVTNLWIKMLFELFVKKKYVFSCLLWTHLYKCVINPVLHIGPKAPVLDI